MAAVSVYLANSILNAVLRDASYTSPVTVYLACYTTNPTANDTGTEVSGGSYSRPSITFAAPSGGTAVNNADVSIPGMPAVTISYLGIRDAAAGGNLLFYGALATPRTLTAGDSFIVRAGDLNAAVS